MPQQEKIITANDREEGRATGLFSLMTLRTLDLFCRVVDNYGDAGVAWRLARQLADEHALQVRLWLDRPEVLGSMEPRLNPAAPRQRVAGVEIHLWQEDFPETEPGDAVIEAFGCPLPQRFLEAMARRRPAPVWINLEYLSAETWVESYHGLPSPHPRLPLTQYFFYPGFTARTGGLLRERGLADRREATQRDPQAFWRSLGLAVPQENMLVVSLFCYPDAAFPSLFETWAQGEQPILALTPGGRDNPAWRDTGIGPWRRGNLEVQPLPFLSQEAYDRLLWACDLNFVRGEDSFVRAQWAARPFVWHIYRQADQAHRVKLEAFLKRYTQTLPASAALALARFHEVWNESASQAAAWPALAGELAALGRHAATWERQLRGQADLARQLVIFITGKI